MYDALITRSDYCSLTRANYVSENAVGVIQSA